MTYFNENFIQFFKDLAANNEREWFHANKKRYEKEVKIPFEKFVEDLIKAIHADDKTVDISPKEAIFRIHRDVRFSKDKTPYKVQVSAIISSGGKKDKTTPGVYIQMGPEHLRVYGGIYGADKDQLYDIRSYIVNNMTAFNKAIKDKEFVKKYKNILGEKNKIIPKEFKEAAEKQDLLFNKQFYYFGEMSPESVMDNDLLDKVMAYYHASKPVKKFLTKALVS